MRRAYDAATGKTYDIHSATEDCMEEEVALTRDAAEIKKLEPHLTMACARAMAMSRGGRDRYPKLHAHQYSKQPSFSARVLEAAKTINSEYGVVDLRRAIFLALLADPTLYDD